MKRLSSSALPFLLASTLGATLVAPPSLAVAAPQTATEATSSAKPTADNSGSTASPGVESTDAEKRLVARERFENGIRLFEEGEYQLALLEFERAYGSTSDYRVLYNIGQVRIQLGRYARAVEALQQYLRESTDRIPPDRQAAVAADLRMLAGRTAHLLVTSNVEGAEILVDDVVVTESPMPAPRLIDAGERRVTVRKAGYLPRTVPVALAGRDEQTVEVRLTPEPPAAHRERTVIVERPRVVPPTTPAPVSHRTTYLWAGWIGTTLLAAGSVTTGLLGRSAYNERQDALKHETTQGRLDTLASRADGYFLTADILGAAALVAGGTTLYFTLTGPKSEQPSLSPQKGSVAPSVSLGPGHASLDLTGAF